MKQHVPIKKNPAILGLPTHRSMNCMVVVRWKKEGDPQGTTSMLRTSGFKVNHSGRASCKMTHCACSSSIITTLLLQVC